MRSSTTYQRDGNGNNDQVGNETGDAESHEDLEEELALRHLRDGLPDGDGHDLAAQQRREEEGQRPAPDEYYHAPEEAVDAGLDGEESSVEEYEARFRAPQGDREDQADGPLELWNVRREAPCLAGKVCMVRYLDGHGHLRQGFHGRVLHRGWVLAVSERLLGDADHETHPNPNGENL